MRTLKTQQPVTEGQAVNNPQDQTYKVYKSVYFRDVSEPKYEELTEEQLKTEIKYALKNMEIRKETIEKMVDVVKFKLDNVINEIELHEVCNDHNRHEYKELILNDLEKISKDILLILKAQSWLDSLNMTKAEIEYLKKKVS